MRYTTLRIWSAVAAALGTAALADVATEYAADLGWLGAGGIDHHQEAVLPVLLLALGVAAGLTLAILRAGIEPGDLLLTRLGDLRARLFDAAAAFALAALAVVAMESYETLYGGASCFDPRSVLVSHAPWMVAAFLLSAFVLRVVIGSALSLAVRARAFAVQAIASFLRRRGRAAARATSSHRSRTVRLRFAGPPPSRARSLRSPPLAAR
ncbi:MAG TPA: hypothetical protein VMH02_10790 [Verrucomicrobiae bacterium]|nr:hypothetical protein [Verrucomicrobiae bacterium]